MATLKNSDFDYGVVPPAEQEYRMQLEWLEDFIELARTRSLSRAAENRCVTHPAFGRRIRALEEWVGTALIERKQPLSLTPCGVLFLNAATQSLALLTAGQGAIPGRHPESPPMDARRI